MIKKTKNIVLYPAAFGYGPAVHALSILDVLKKRNINANFYIVGNDFLDYLLLKSNLIEKKFIIRKLDFKVLFSDKASNLIIPITNNEILPELYKYEVDVLVVDALLWMWNDLPKIPNNVIKYLALAFPKVRNRVNELKKIILTEEIDQITIQPEYFPSHREGLIINLGGAFSPYGCSYDYLASLICDISEVAKEHNIKITCSPTCKMELINKGIELEILTINPFEMLDLLAKSEVLITLPGLSIIWDSIIAKIKTVVVPGINYSQHLQPLTYKNSVQNLPILNWGDIKGFKNLNYGLNESSAVKRTMDIADNFAKDTRNRAFMRDWLRQNLLNQSNVFPQLHLNHPFKGFNGANTVADSVSDWFNKNHDL